MANDEISDGAKVIKEYDEGDSTAIIDVDTASFDPSGSITVMDIDTLEYWQSTLPVETVSNILI